MNKFTVATMEDAGLCLKHFIMSDVDLVGQPRYSPINIAFSLGLVWRVQGQQAVPLCDIPLWKRSGNANLNQHHTNIVRKTIYLPFDNGEII